MLWRPRGKPQIGAREMQGFGCVQNLLLNTGSSEQYSGAWESGKRGLILRRVLCTPGVSHDALTPEPS